MPDTTDTWISDFPILSDMDGMTRGKFLSAAKKLTVPAGTVIFRPGSECLNYLLVLNGTVRVQMVSETGREIVLYRVDRGQTCVLTTSCLMSHKNYNAEGVTETDVVAIALPTATFTELMGLSEHFRRFVFSAYGERVTTLLMLVEEVAFGRIDLRLAKFLLERRGASGGLAMTHQELAAELGSAREVISRQLKDFERKGWVALKRGRIDVVDPAALANLEKNRFV